jgi:hypothetical protein
VVFFIGTKENPTAENSKKLCFQMKNLASESRTQTNLKLCRVQPTLRKVNLPVIKTHKTLSPQAMRSALPNCITNSRVMNFCKSSTKKCFYILAKSTIFTAAPIVPTVPNPQSEDLTETTEKTPTFPEIIYQNLPGFLQRATAKATFAEDKDLLLLGSLVAVSSCLPNIYGIYAERKISPNLFLFITASASAGKGRLTPVQGTDLPHIPRTDRTKPRCVGEISARPQQLYPGKQKRQARNGTPAGVAFTNVNHSRQQQRNRSVSNPE